jgi:hypothetical protein
MMELDNLKSIWKEVSQPISSLDKAELRSLLKGKTQDALSKINRSIWLEVGACLLATLGFAVGMFFQNRTEQWVLSILILILCIGSVAYYYYKYRQINQISLNTENLRTSLGQLINSLEYFIRFYFQAVIFLAPVCFITGFLYGMASQTDIEKYSHRGYWLIFTSGAILTILLSLTMYPLMRWYLKTLYGYYINDLKTCLSELDEKELEEGGG